MSTREKNAREAQLREAKSAKHGHKYPGVKNRHSSEVVDAEESTEQSARKSCDREIGMHQDDGNKHLGN